MTGPELLLLSGLFVEAFLRTHHPTLGGFQVGVKLMELRFVLGAAGMSGVLMMGLDEGPCPGSTYITQHESNLIAFFALPPPRQRSTHRALAGSKRPYCS
jgi:hypothetical protein